MTTDDIFRAYLAEPACTNSPTIRERVRSALARVLGRRRVVAIDDLIKPPRPRFEGFDWSRTDRLAPTGAAGRDRLLGERFKENRE